MDNQDLKNAISGVLVIDKPIGMTSHDVVNAVRFGTGIRRAGHTGTLDPRASGVLVILVGPAVRLSEYVSASDKRYQAIIRMGASTDTFDADGRFTQQPSAPVVVKSSKPHRLILPSKCADAAPMIWPAKAKRWNLPRAKSTSTIWKCSNGPPQKWLWMCIVLPALTSVRWRTIWATPWAVARILSVCAEPRAGDSVCAMPRPCANSRNPSVLGIGTNS